MSKKINVLMIDDNEIITSKVKEYFSKHEVINLVLTAVNGKEGLDLIVNQKDKYDLILMDLIMPEIDGIALLEKMKAVKLMIIENINNGRMIFHTEIPEAFIATNS